ncbi:Conserved_hypothetical protein [Hexamita inflata]|uniref:Uncharacterized protein n=1 Tax=Hexamita inflata TaxID=28002 RepID=A0AA86PK43_9EUKA|nr:Conserved hypothetical protein [Hexamita inflata]
MLNDQILKIIKGKDYFNELYLSQLSLEINQETIDNLQIQIQNTFQILADCGLKLKSKKTKAQVNFGEAVSKELIISLLLQNPLLLTIFLAYLGGNLESDKYLCQQFLIKNFDPKAENRMLLSSGFCSRLSKVVYQQLSEKSIVNVSQYGGYYSNYWTNIQGMLLDSPYGQDILDGLLEHTCNTLMTRQAEGDDIEVLLFMCLQNILEQFERNNAKLYPWFKKQQIQNKNEILQQIEAPDATEDELGYKLLFFLFKHKNLHILCDEDSHRIKKIVNQLQDDFTLPESYTSSEYIQQRRIIFVQLTFNLFTKSLNQFCMIHSEQVISSEIGQFMKQIARQAFDYVSQVTEDPMYITELMKEHNLTKEVDKFQDYLLYYMGQDTGISKNAERLLTLLAQIQVDKQYKGAAMNSFFSNMANVLQSQFVGNDIVLMFNNLLMSLLPPAKKGVQQQPTKYLKLYYLMQLVQNYSDEDDKREAFIRGLFLTSSLNDLCDCVSENIDYFRRYYQYNSQFLKQDFQNKMSTIAETIQLKDIHFDSVSKKIHSSIDNNEVLEDVQSEDDMPPEDFPAPEEVPEQVNDDVPTELPEVQEEPIVEEQIVQKENVEEPVPEFVENMPSLNGFEAVAQAQQESNQNGEEYKDLESHENEHNDTQQQAAALEESTKHNEEPHEPEHVAEGHEENTSHQENAHDAINVPEEKQECQDELINDIPTDLPLISAQDQEEVIHSTQHQEQAPDLNCDHTDTINEPEAPQENAQQEIEQNNVVEENNHIIEEAKQFEIEHNDSMDKHTVEDQKDDMPPEDFPAPEEVPEQVNDDVPTELPEVQEDHGHVEQEQIEQYTVNSQEQLVSTKQVFAQFSSKKVYEESEELPDNSLLLSHIASGPKDIDSIMDTQVDVKSLLNIKNLVNADGTSNKQLKKALTDDIKALLSGNGSLQEQIKELMEKELAEEEIHCTFENELVLFKKLTDIGKMYKQTKDSNKQFMQNGKLTMGNLLNFIEPTPIQLNSELTEFLTKCNKIFAKTQMQTAKLVFSPNKTSSPLDLAACNLLQALYEQDTNPECQTQTCCCCSSNMTNYKYSYYYLEKLLLSKQSFIGICEQCLRIGHKLCLYDKICEDCKQK